MAAVGDVIDIRTSRPTAGITSGIATLDDVASNLGPGGVIGAAVMVVGALLACFGLRWASGMAGGAGLALAGWAALTIGLVEVPVGEAESITRASEQRLHAHRDPRRRVVVGRRGRRDRRGRLPRVVASGATSQPAIPQSAHRWRSVPCACSCSPSDPWYRSATPRGATTSAHPTRRSTCPRSSSPAAWRRSPSSRSPASSGSWPCAPTGSGWRPVV